MANLSEKCKSFVSSLKTYWKTPPKGRYIPFKEIAAYSIGGIGVQFVVYGVGYIGLSATSLLAGSALGLKNGDLVTLNLIATVINIFLGPLRGLIFDNTRSRAGKFRPYLLFAGFVTAAVATVFSFLPFESMGYNEKLWALFITYMLIQVFSPFYSTAYSTLAQVMSPNSNERADVLTVSTFIYSIAPSITGFLVPIISGYMGGMEHIDAYRVIMPAFSIGGAVFGLISYFGTKERIIVSKDYTPKVPFFKGIAAGIQNKHQWGLSIQGWFLLLQQGVGNITTWYFYYGIKDVLGLSTEQQGIMNGTLITVIGFASTPAMLLSPLLIRKIGKRSIVILYTVLNIICTLGMYIFIDQIWVLFVFLWLRSFFNAFNLVTTPAINADVLDYQQYKTGQRLEGLLSQFMGFIGTFVSMGVTYFLNTVIMQNRFGLVDNYDDLYSAAFREPISRAMLILGIIGNLLSLIPFTALYTLTEREHTSHIAVLKIRAALEDYATDSLSDGQLDEAREIYANALAEAAKYKDALKNAAGREKKKLQKKLDAVNIIIDEKNRFETEQMKKKTAKAKELLSHTVEELYGISEPSMDSFNRANAMSENTREEMQLKDKAIKEASKELDRFHKKAYEYIQARKLIKQLEYYQNWDSIFETESATV